MRDLERVQLVRSKAPVCSRFTVGAGGNGGTGTAAWAAAEGIRQGRRADFVRFITALLTCCFGEGRRR
jgi:hypothetical protein